MRIRRLLPTTPHVEQQFTAGDSEVAFNRLTVVHLTASVIIDLKNSGVSEQVIDFLISTPSWIAGSTPVPEPQTSPYAVQVPPPAPIRRNPASDSGTGLCLG
jgi:hypothetical protein